MSGDSKSRVRARQEAPILLVEDNPDDAFMVMRALGQAGISKPVVHLQNGEEAVDYLCGKPPYENRAKYPIPVLVLLDLKMPRLNGFDLLTWLQNRPDLAKVPVVVLTGSVRAEDRSEAEKLGAVGYQVKPVAFSDLVQIVQQMDTRWLSSSGR